MNIEGQVNQLKCSNHEYEYSKDKSPMLIEQIRAKIQQILKHCEYKTLDF